MLSLNFLSRFKASGDQPAPHHPHLLVTSFHKYSKVSTSIPLLSLGPLPLPPQTCSTHHSSTYILLSTSNIYDDTPRKTIKPTTENWLNTQGTHRLNIMLPLKITHSRTERMVGK